MNKTTEPLKDASHLYEVEYSAYHLERPGFRVSELKILPTQSRSLALPQQYLLRHCGASSALSARPQRGGAAWARRSLPR